MEILQQMISAAEKDADRSFNKIQEQGGYPGSLGSCARWTLDLLSLATLATTYRVVHRQEPKFSETTYQGMGLFSDKTGASRRL